MVDLIRFFVKHYVFSIAIFAAVVFFGLSAAVRLGIDLLPEFDVPIVAVSASYQGAGSQETAEQLAQPIEDAVATVPGVTDVSSFSGEGYTFVVVQFDASIDVDQAAIDVRQQVDGIEESLPDDATRPVIQKFDPADEPIMSIAVAGEGLPLQEVQRVAEDVLEPRLQQVVGVADVSVVGPIERQIQVLVDPGELRAYGLGPSQVANAIGASSLTLPAGTLTFGDERILLSLRSQPHEASDVAEMVVDPARGLRVTDVARVVDAPADQDAFTRLDGRPVVVLEVFKTSGSNTVTTARELRATLEELSLPEGISVATVGDTSVFVEASVFDTLRETGLAILAVALVVLLFVGRLGSTFSVVLAIPITLTGAIVIFGLLGFTFNTVTLLAVTVAVGLVVDDSIVIAESVERWRAKGLPLVESVLKGAGEVSVAVLTATLSLLAVFLPIAFLPGLIGQFFSQFGLSLAATIFVSYLEAMFFLTVRLAYLPNPLPPGWRRLVPASLALPRDLGRALGSYGRRRTWLLVAVLAIAGAADGLYGGAAAETAGLTPGPGTAALLGAILLAAGLALPWAWAILVYASRLLGTFAGAIVRTAHEATDGAVTHVRERYAGALRRILTPAGSTWTLLAAAGLVASLAFVFPRIQFNFISPIDTGAVAVGIEFPPGTPLERTDVVSARVERELRMVPEVRHVLANVGGGGLLGGSTSGRSSITLELVGGSQRVRSSFDVADAVRPRIEALVNRIAPEATVTVGSDDGGVVPVETAFSLTLSAQDRDLLEERDDRARQLLRDSPWLRNVSSSLEGTAEERVLVLDRSALAGTGLTAAEIGQTLRAYNVGVRAGNLQAGGAEVPIVVRADPRVIADEQSLLSLPIRAPAIDVWLPLGTFGRFEVQSTPSTIDRADQAYVSTLAADFAPGAPGQFQVRAEMEEVFAAAGVTDEDVRVGTGVGPDLLGDLVFYGPIAFALALILNYLVIASQFNSFKYPFYLLLTVPLALVGAFWLFFLTGRALDVISVLGVVILIGLVTKNAILLLDVVVQGLEADETLEDALVRAGRLRLRPIVMTALTVVIITIPLLMGLGEGAEFRQPLGLVILGGVVSSTFLTLFVVPAAFYRFERRNFPTARAADRAPTPRGRPVEASD